MINTALGRKRPVVKICGATSVQCTREVNMKLFGMEMRKALHLFVGFIAVLGFLAVSAIVVLALISDVDGEVQYTGGMFIITFVFFMVVIVGLILLLVEAHKFGSAMKQDLDETQGKLAAAQAETQTLRGKFEPLEAEKDRLKEKLDIRTRQRDRLVNASAKAGFYVARAIDKIDKDRRSGDREIANAKTLLLKGFRLIIPVQGNFKFARGFGETLRLRAQHANTRNHRLDWCDPYTPVDDE